MKSACRHSISPLKTTDFKPKCDVGMDMQYKISEMPCFARNKLPCEYQTFPTQEEIDAEEQMIACLLKGVGAARAAIIATGKQNGTLPCPQCGKILSFTVSTFNGHVWAKCETPGCLNWME